MLVTTEKITAILEEKGLSQYKFAHLVDYSRGALGSMIKGRDAFPEDVVEKMAPVLGVCADEIRSWILVDKYSKEVLEFAIQAKKESTNNDKLILTTKIDEILQNKNMSRTQLSKLAKYDQSSVNKMLTGKGSVSKTVLTKLSNALEIPENKIKSWIVADKYPLQILESALTLKLF